MNPLTMSPSISTSVASRSGDASAGLTTPFTYQGAFQVGGSGSQTQSAAQSASTDSGIGGSNTVIYIALGVAALALVVTMLRR